MEARREDSRRRLEVVLAINLVLLVAEAVGGFITGSLAVLADAGHVLSDVGAIVLALIAARLAARPASSRRTFGYQRSEVLAALANGLTLVAVSVFIGVEAITRSLRSGACASVSGVWMKPGCTEFTRMPSAT